MRRSSPSRSRCRRWAPAPISASIRSRTGTIRSPRSCSRRQPRPHARRDARQRRQPARLRGAQRAAARQGQGQQRVVRDRAVHPPVRRRLRASTTCARCELDDARGRAGRLRARRLKLDRDDQPRSARPGRAGDRPQPPVSRRLGAVPRHHVRADQGPPRTGTGLHARRRRYRDGGDAEARRARQPRQSPRTGLRRGPTAWAR